MGLWLGLLAGVLLALVKMAQTRREDQEWDAGPAEWPPVETAAPEAVAPEAAAAEAAAAEAAAPEPVSTDSTASSELSSIAECESGGDYTANTGNGFYGAYQFTPETWAGVGGSGLPSEASAAEQDMRAQMLLEQSGTSPWPVCGG